MMWNQDCKQMCISTRKDDWLPDPLKMAKCIISKPRINEMGEEEEKIYCGMIYGPEYSEYEHKAKKRIAKTITRLLLKHVPIMNELMEKRNKENQEKIQKDFKIWLDQGKKAILKEKEEELTQMEATMMKKIPLEREKALSALQGNIKKEMEEVCDKKKEYLKSAFEFQMNWFLKDNEQVYIDRINLYSIIWNKILRKLKEKAKRKISELNCAANQSIDMESVKAIVEKENDKTDQIVQAFYDRVDEVARELKTKVLSEEIHILQEKGRGQKIKKTVDIWNSLLEHVIMLFDKVVLYGFQGTPGLCNYFVGRGIIEKINKSLKEVEDMVSVTSKSLDKINEVESSEEISPFLSRERSVFTVDMTVDPPDIDLILELNLFQVKKLIEEATCEVLAKPLQIAPFMKDRSVELKSFSEDSNQKSSYILDRLSNAYGLIKKILFKSENKQIDPVVPKEVPYTIEMDQELKNRIDYLIKCYRHNPNNMRALTNV